MLTNGKRCKIKVQNNIVLNPKDGGAEAIRATVKEKMELFGSVGKA